MPLERHVRLFRHGRHQALRIPREFELEADEAIIRRDGARLIIEPVQRRLDLAALLAGWQPIDESWSDIDAGLQPLDDIRLCPFGCADARAALSSPKVRGSGSACSDSKTEPTKMGVNGCSIGSC